MAFHTIFNITKLHEYIEYQRIYKGSTSYYGNVTEVDVLNLPPSNDIHTCIDEIPSILDILKQ